MASILIQGWTVHKVGDEYYLPYIHWIYLKEILKYYDDICIVAPVEITKDNSNQFSKIGIFNNVNVYPVYHTECVTYISGAKNFFSFFKVYKSLRNFDVTYARYPDPFLWLQKVFFSKSKRIIHFVGRPIDTIFKNPNINIIKKVFIALFFLPEQLMHLWACKGAKIFTNGKDIHNHLGKLQIKSKPLISSVLTKNDFNYNPLKKISNIKPKLLYIGYLRRAKGVDTVIKSFALLQNKFPEAELTIVGDGETKQELCEIIKKNSIKNVHFLGHINDRSILNDIMRNHDIFCFASLSEGSPRVVIEAMANGLNVVSTPVGSLPHVFIDGKDIAYFDLNNHQMLYEKVISLINDSNNASLMRESAYQKIKEYTLENFYKKIFYDK
jgi:glycosyltransferase involved in cell wall biosynthesis